MKHVPSKANSSLKYKNRHFDKKERVSLLHHAKKCIKKCSGISYRRARERSELANKIDHFSLGNDDFLLGMGREMSSRPESP